MIQHARFECTKCGECCFFSPGSTVWVTEEELARLTRYLGWRPITRMTGDGRMSLVPAASEWMGYCELFDVATKTCRAYDARPAQCRSYPFWPGLMQSEASWERAANRCEGIGRGELITEDELLARLREAPRGL